MGIEVGDVGLALSVPAAGLSSTMTEAGFSEGTDLVLGLETVGLLSGLLIGALMINRGGLIPGLIGATLLTALTIGLGVRRGLHV